MFTDGTAGAQTPASFFEIQKAMLTVSDVAQLLGCTERHIRNLIADDQIPYVKVGRLVRFYRLALLEWIQKGGSR